MWLRPPHHRAGSLLAWVFFALALSSASHPVGGDGWRPRVGRAEAPDPTSAAGTGRPRHAEAPASPGAAKGTPRQSRFDLPAHAKPLPDTVLAVIGRGRRVTVGAFRTAWAQVLPPARPDSLTPRSAREFLDLLVDKELLAERAMQESWEWTPLESTQVATLRDRIMMRTALDSALAGLAAARAARGEPALAPEALGVALRESTVAGLAPTFDDSLVVRLARAFAALPRPAPDSTLGAHLRLLGQMPAVDPSDTARVVAWSREGTYRVAELLAAWGTLSPLVRPRVESPDQMRDLVKNGLFERALRRKAERRQLERHPDVVEAVERQREHLASRHFVTREVHGRIPTDEATLRRYYERDPAAWMAPMRLRIVRLLLAERSEAARMAQRLRDPAAAETLVARGLRQGVDYRAEITAPSDSALFAAALRSGTGTVLGPDSTSGGWQVVRMSALLPSRRWTFEEVRDLVWRAFLEGEGERRTRALLADLRGRSPVTVNTRALAELAEADRPAPARPARARPPR